MTQRVKAVDDRRIVTDTGWDEADDEIGFDWRPFISVDPEIVFGKPRVTGTRLAVEYLLGLFAAGRSEAAILDSFPGLTQSHLRAVFAYAASLAKERQERPEWMSKPGDDPDAQSHKTGPRALPQ